MALMSTELYEALREAGVRDDKARQAAEAVAHLATRPTPPTRTCLDLGWGLHHGQAAHDSPPRDPPTWLDLGRGVQALLWVTAGVLLRAMLLAGGH